MGRSKYRKQVAAIDFKVSPFIPDGWTVRSEDQLSRVLTGQVALDMRQIRIRQIVRDSGEAVAAEIQRLCVCDEYKYLVGARALDVLLEQKRLIPVDWCHRYVDFWGTIYRDGHGNRYVRCLFWDGGQWYWSSRSLDMPWPANRFVATLRLVP